MVFALPNALRAGGGPCIVRGTMPRLGRFFLLTVGILAAAPLAAAAGPAGALAALAAPRAGTALVAGETASIEWTPGPEIAPLSAFEEWEAFLSVDGGRHYAVRITPHLDRALRRVRFRVPDLPTADARILLRFGDERREVALELPERFSIARAPGAGLDWAEEAAAPAASLRAGEPARPGEIGVSRWIEGSRQGGGLREVAAAPPPGAEGVTEPASGRGALAATAPERAPDALPAPEADPSDSGPPPATDLRDRPRAAPHAPDVLLLSRRRNE